MAFPLNNRVRVAGSGYTIFYFQGQPIYFAQQVSHTSPAPVGPGAVAIHPIDEPYPVQVITPAASGMGSLTLNLYELYGKRVWERLGQSSTQDNDSTSFAGDIPTGTGFLDGAVDLVDVFIRIAAQPERISVVKRIRSPFLNGQTPISYSEHYNNAVVTNIVDGETIEIGSMEVVKQVTIAYTHVTRVDQNGNTTRSSAWSFRDPPAA